MSLGKKVLAGSAFVTGGEVIGWGAAFIRNMVLARVLTKEDFGLAATCTMAMSLLELTEKVAISRLVVQNKQGATPRFMAVAHFAQLTASIFGAIAVLIFAGPIAKGFGIEAHTTTLRFLGLLLFLKGFEHFDIYRMERDLRFMPSTICAALPQLISVAIAAPVAMWLGDFRAVLVLLGIKSIATIILTHVFAEQRFQVAFDRDIMRTILSFSWPLLLNGFLMLAVFQGDQFVVASFYSMAELGEYAAAAALASAPTFIASRVLSSVMLPVMSRAQEDVEEFSQRYRFCIETIPVIATLYLVSTLLAAQSWITFAYGSKYRHASELLMWLSISNALRMIRVAPAIAALSKGDSRNQMISNILRISSLLVAVTFAVWNFPVRSIAITGLFGEAAALGFSVRRLYKRDGIKARVTILPVAAICLVSAAALIGNPLLEKMPVWIAVTVATVLGIVGSLIIFRLFPGPAKFLASELHNKKSDRVLEVVEP